MSFPGTDQDSVSGSLGTPGPTLCPSIKSNMSSPQMRAGVSQTIENWMMDFPYVSHANGARPPPDLINLYAPSSSPARFESSARISPVIPLARGVKVVG